jgi:hypothetical protein
MMRSAGWSLAVLVALLMTGLVVSCTPTAEQPTQPTQPANPSHATAVIFAKGMH